MSKDKPPGWNARTWIGPPTRTTRVLYAIVRGLIKAVAVLFGRVRVVGQENVPAEGAFVLAPVHRSNVDFALTSLVTKRTMRYMGKDSVWKLGPIARLSSKLGAFPVHRGRADREALRVCIDVIEGGSPLVMFPEGQRRTGPVVEDLFDGTAYVAARTGVPIVPMGIGGSERMMPKGAKFIHPSKIVLLVGEPILPARRDDGRRPPRSEIRSLTEELGKELQRLFDEAQGLAGARQP